MLRKLRKLIRKISPFVSLGYSDGYKIGYHAAQLKNVKKKHELEKLALNSFAESLTKTSSIFLSACSVLNIQTEKCYKCNKDCSKYIIADETNTIICNDCFVENSVKYFNSGFDSDVFHDIVEYEDEEVKESKPILTRVK